MKKMKLLLVACLLNLCFLPSSCHSSERQRMKWPAPGGSPSEVVYQCGGGISLEELADCGCTLYTHFSFSPDREVTKKFIERAHRLGIKVLPYVSAEKAWDDFNLVQSRNPVAAVPFYYAVSPKEHKDWIFVRSDGVEQARYARYKDGKWIWDIPPGPGSWYMCPNSPGYVEAVLKGCRDTMEMGFDGLFIDNVGVRRLDTIGICCGPRHGKHQHIYPEKDERYAYTELIKKMAETIKSSGKDKIVFMNGGLEQPFDSCRDAGMIESYCVSSFLGPEHQKNWTREYDLAKRHMDETRTGRIITCLPYIDGKDRPARDDAFYCFACCKLSGFTWASTTATSLSSLFLRTSSMMGQPVSDFVEKDGIHYRLYEKGLVAVNPSNRNREITLTTEKIPYNPVSLYDGNWSERADGIVKLALPASSGRVYIGREEALRIFLEEMRFWLRRTALGNKRWNGQNLLEDTELARKSPDLTEALREIETLLSKLPGSGLKTEENLALIARLKLPKRVSELFSQAVSAAFGISAAFEIEPKFMTLGDTIPAVFIVKNYSGIPLKIISIVPQGNPGLKITASTPPLSEIAPGGTGTVTFTINREEKESSSAFKPYYKILQIFLTCSLNDREFQLVCAAPAWLVDGVAAISLSDTGISPPWVTDIRLLLENLLKKNVSYDIVVESKTMKLSPIRRTVLLPSEGKTENILTVADDTLPPGRKDINVQLYHVSQQEDRDESLAYIPGGPIDPAADKAPPAFSTQLSVNVVPTIFAPRVSSAPVIDGKLNDACWKKAAVLDNFRIISSQKKAQGQTSVWLCRDDKYLYIGIKCKDGRIDSQNAGYSIFTNRNRVEAFLDTDRLGKEFLRCTATSGGKFQIDRRISGLPADTHVSSRHKIIHKKNSWTAEIALGFENLSEKPDEDTVWKINICRENFGEYSQWSAGKGFHDYSVFGYLKFK